MLNEKIKYAIERIPETDFVDDAVAITEQLNVRREMRERFAVDQDLRNFRVHRGRNQSDWSNLNINEGTYKLTAQFFCKTLYKQTLLLDL